MKHAVGLRQKQAVTDMDLESFCDSYFSFLKIFLIFILSCYYLIFL